MHRCYFCKGPVEDKVIRVIRNKSGSIQVIEGVPAEVCMRCGLESYPGWVAREMDRLVADETPDTLLHVPQFTFKKTPPSAKSVETDLITVGTGS